MAYKRLSAAEAAAMIKNDENLALSGFTPAGAPKAVTKELAKIAEAEHAAGKPFKVSTELLTPQTATSERVSMQEKSLITTFTSAKWHRKCGMDSSATSTGLSWNVAISKREKQPARRI